MSMSEFSAFDAMPARLSRNQSAFGKYATSFPASDLGWSPEAASLMNTPLGMTTVAPQSLSTQSMELLTPDSLQTGYPAGLVTADNSPLVDELDLGDMQSWDSLFEDAKVADDAKPRSFAPQPQPTIVDMTGAELVTDVDLNFDFSVLDQVKREPVDSLTPPGAAPPGSSPRSVPRGGISKSVPKSKVDDLGITVYKRKPRSAPLKPVEVPHDGDEAGAKRAKNTEAARRSRARKLERMTQLEERIRLLMDENESLRAEVAALRGERA